MIRKKGGRKAAFFVGARLDSARETAGACIKILNSPVLPLPKDPLALTL